MRLLENQNQNGNTVKSFQSPYESLRVAPTPTRPPQKNWTMRELIKAMMPRFISTIIAKEIEPLKVQKPTNRVLLSESKDLCEGHEKDTITKAQVISLLKKCADKTCLDDTTIFVDKATISTYESSSDQEIDLIDQTITKPFNPLFYLKYNKIVTARITQNADVLKAQQEIIESKDTLIAGLNGKCHVWRWSLFGLLGTGIFFASYKGKFPLEPMRYFVAALGTFVSSYGLFKMYDGYRNDLSRQMHEKSKKASEDKRNNLRANETLFSTLQKTIVEKLEKYVQEDAVGEEF